MFAGLTLVTPPVAEPVSVADAKAHSRIFTSVDDNLVAGYISSARMKCEATCMRAFLTQQWQYSLQHFPGRPLGVYREAVTRDEYYKWSYIKVPLPPLVSVDQFAYYDTLNNQYLMTVGYGNTVGNYFVDLSHEPGRICLPFAGIWPTTILLPSSPIQILFTAGWPFTAGVVNVDTFGNVSPASSPPSFTFDPRMVGTWVTIGGISYNVLAYVSPSRIILAGAPSVAVTNAAFTGNVVPMPIRHAILFLAGHFYENREPVITGRGEVAIEIPDTVDEMLSPYRVYEYTN